MRDIDVRQALRRRLASRYASDPSTRVVEEMGIWANSVRIDVAVINGELIGYEIKSERDTLERLPLQAEIYSLVFDKVNLVIADRHLIKGQGVVPDWWGLITSCAKRSRIELKQVRPAKRNRNLSPIHLARLLHREEALSILESLNAASGVRSKALEIVLERLVAILSVSDLRIAVREALRQRQWSRKLMAD